jgi:hypothetical protein
VAAPLSSAGLADEDSDVDLGDRQFKVGGLHDCWCRRKWCVARVARIGPPGDRVELAFPGFIDKWNETLETADVRIAALGSKCPADQVERALAANA